MNQNQLQQARLARWRQDGNALATLDDAERWLAETPLCLYLPRPQHLPIPAPTFVEAIAGRADPTPAPEQLAAAAQMLARLVASGAVIALNLFGAAPGIGISSFVGEHPDFLATPEALPYLYALQPERNPKRPPTTVGGARVSPLAAEAYTLLEREAALTTLELRSRLGREVTEAAVLRSLAELWHTMRVVPVPADNPQEGAHWELLSARHRRELNLGSTQSQTTALSILISFYLQSAIAATREEVEIFLSPVASRSRIREVVHGLSATRQLASFSLAGDEQFYVEGTLPEVAEEEETVALAAGAVAGEDAGLEQNEPSLTEAAAANPDAMTQRKRAAPRSPRPAFGERARGSFAARERRTAPQDRPPRREGGFRRPERSDSRGMARGGSPQRGGFSRPTRPAGEEGTAPRPNFERRARPSFAASAGRRDRPARPGGPRTSDRPKPSERSDRPARFDRGSGAGAARGGFAKRPSFGKGRPPRPGGSSFRPSKPFGDRPGRSGEGTDRPRFHPAAGAGSPRFEKDRAARPPRDGERPRRSFGSGPGRPFRKPQGEYGPTRSAGGARRFEGAAGRPADRPGGSKGQGGFSRPPSRDRGPRPPSRAGASRPPFRGGQSRPQGDRPFKRPFAAAGDRPPRRGPAGPATRGPAGSFAKSSGGDRPPRKFTPRAITGSSEGKPEGVAGASRPFRASGQRPSRPGGWGKPGGAPAKPFGKPRPAGAGYGKPRSVRAGADSAGRTKNRTSTTTSSGKPRRPGGFGSGAPGASSGRPPAKGSFGDFKPRAKPSARKRPGGTGAPKRKPRGESRPGEDS